MKYHGLKVTPSREVKRKEKEEKEHFISHFSLYLYRCNIMPAAIAFLYTRTAIKRAGNVLQTLIFNEEWHKSARAALYILSREEVEMQNLDLSR